MPSFRSFRSFFLGPKPLLQVMNTSTSEAPGNDDWFLPGCLFVRIQPPAVMIRRVLAAPAMRAAGALLILSAALMFPAADAFAPTLGGITARHTGVPALRVVSPQAGPARLRLQTRQRRRTGGVVMMADEVSHLTPPARETGCARCLRRQFCAANALRISVASPPPLSLIGVCSRQELTGGAGLARGSAGATISGQHFQQEHRTEHWAGCARSSYHGRTPVHPLAPNSGIIALWSILRSISGLLCGCRCLPVALWLLSHVT